MKNCIRVALVILVVIIVSASIGGNPSNDRAGGCLWVGQGDENQSATGSSGLLGLAIISTPYDGGSGIPVNVNLSWNSVTNATYYDVYFGIIWCG